MQFLVCATFPISVISLYCGVIQLIKYTGIKLSSFRHAAVNWNKYLTIYFSILCPSLSVKTVNKGWDLWSHLLEQTLEKHVRDITHYDKFSEKYFKIDASTVVIPKMKVKSSNLSWETFSSLVSVKFSKIFYST